ncbi:MAG: hypothetical protein K2N64_00675 [Anaeroplasmataceae bacterium]|nr:hypothetical protein [Anaeroplasmataceae bacterium]
MEALLELVIELIIELFGEILAELISAAFANFSSYIEANTKAKKILKYLLATLIFSATFVLLVMSFWFKKTLYVGLVIGYFIILLLLYIVKFLNRNLWKKSKVEKRIIWINRGVHYLFPMVLILFAIIHRNKATPAIVILSCAALFIYFLIHLYRLQIKNKKSAYISFIKKYRKKAKEYQLNPQKRIVFLNFLSKNKESFIIYIQKDITIEDFKLLKDILIDLSGKYQSRLVLGLLEEAQSRLNYFILNQELIVAYEGLNLQGKD